MSVLCCHVPDFLISLARRRQPVWCERPLALIGPDERIWAVSPEARSSGVQPQMRPQQAQVYCPELYLSELDLAHSDAQQAALLDAVARWELPVEPLGWGAAYVGLTAVADKAAAVQPLAVELGRRVRGALGDELQPSLGWDSGKFTARAAAVQAAPGRIRLVDKADEVRFLGPLPIALLPLPHAHLQQLHWLGVRTLGQYAMLPAAAVWQRFGAAGKLAQRWVQGKDDRPVRDDLAGAPPRTTIDLDPPTVLLRQVIDALMGSLQPTLAHLAKELAGLRRLRLILEFVSAPEYSIDTTFVEPASQPGRVQAALAQQLGGRTWPGAAQRISWQVLATGELAAHQLTLFDEPQTRLASLDAIARGLTGRYGNCLFHGRLIEPHHPLAERRSRLESLAS